jgi:DNA-binding beta-propeller fold protein YncE
VVALSTASTNFSGIAQADPVESIPLTSQTPSGMAISPDGTFAYVASYGFGNGGGLYGLEKVNLSTGTSAGFINFPSAPMGVAVNSAGTTAYVTRTDAQRVAVVDLVTDTVTANWAVASNAELANYPTPNPGKLAVKGGFVYTANTASSSVSKINIADGTHTTIDLRNPDDLSASVDPDSIVVDAAGTFGYVSTNYAIIKINLSAGTVVARWSTAILGARVYGMALDPTGTYLYGVGDSTNGDVSSFLWRKDLATLAVTRVLLKRGTTPAVRSIALNPAGTFAYTLSPWSSFSDSFPGEVFKVNLSKVSTSPADAVSAMISVPHGSSAIALNAAGTIAYATSFGVGDNSLTKIDLFPSPTASLTASDSIVPVGGSVTFNSAGSVALWGETITSFDWDLDGSGRYATPGTATRSETFSSVGTKTIGVRIHAPTGTSDATQTVTVVPDTVTPNLSASSASVLLGDEVRFTAAGSTALSGSIAGYEWDLDGNGSFETAGGAAISHTFSAVGNHSVTVRVTSRGGSTATATTVVGVTIAPPAGEVGVSINGGSQFTNNPEVKVSLVWPRSAVGARLSNDGGFRDPGQRDLAPAVNWTLASSGPERLPKTVYVRFSGTANETQTFQDDIILDETPPVIASAGIASLAGISSAAKARTYRTKVRASDKTSGVASAQFATDKSKKKLSKTQKYLSAMSFKSALKPLWVRVQDRAGNFSKWSKLP